MDKIEGRSVCVFCGSRNGTNPVFAQAAKDLGKMLAEENLRLVYGAGDVGLMGYVARATQTNDGDTFGVIPVGLMKREVGKRDLSSFVVTETMHERKKVMFMNSDCIITLPGGLGSLDELFEVLTWRQLELHNKPIFLLNIAGFWEPLVALINHVIAEGFAGANVETYFELVDDVPALRDRLRDLS